MRKELCFYNKDLGQQKFVLQRCSVNIYRRTDFNGLTNELFNQKQFVSENFNNAKKFLTKTFKEIKEENLDVVIANHIEIEAKIQNRKRIINLTNFWGSNREFIEDVNEVDLPKMLSESIEKIITDYRFTNYIYNNKVLTICLSQRIVASFKDKKISFPEKEKYVIWFVTYFKNKTM